MTKKEYNEQTKIINETYGLPEFDKQGMPLNECATKLTELKNSYTASQQQRERISKLSDKIEKLKDKKAVSIGVPEEVVRQEWLIAFNDKQKAVVIQWLSNVKQTTQEIAKALDVSNDFVKNTMKLEAFNLLRRHLTSACKEMLPLESILAVREALVSNNDATRLKAALTILVDAGMLKGSSVEEAGKADVVLNQEKLEELNKLGNDILGLGKAE